MTNPRTPPPERPSLEAVLAAAARVSGFTQEQIRRRLTLKGLSVARQVAVLVMAERCAAGYPRIGAFMDRRSPQAAAQAAGQARSRIEHSAALRDLYNGILARLPGEPAARREDPRKLPARRKCLMCAKIFASSDCGNRVCLNCKTTQLWKTGGDPTVRGPA